MRRLKKKKEKTRNGDELRVNIINSSTRTEGNISCQSSIRFDGKHKGEIKAINKIVIGDTALIEGNLYAESIEILGDVVGNCYANKTLSLSSSSNFKGNIFTNQIIIIEGAVFNGNIEMTNKKDDPLIIKAAPINYKSKKLMQKIALFITTTELFTISYIFSGWRDIRLETHV